MEFLLIAFLVILVVFLIGFVTEIICALWHYFH